jgi:LuxR family maltose regulon positive regulatory protein
MTLSSDTLVSTKLRPSRARPKLVARPHLTARLKREPARKLTLISAPAGFGKTTLLVEWLRERAADSSTCRRACTSSSRAASTRPCRSPGFAPATR